MKMFKGKVELKGDYKLEVRKNYFSVYDKIGNEIYYESSNGFWAKSVYDKNNNVIYYEDSTGYMKNGRSKKVLEVTMQDLEEKYGCKVKVIK